MCSFIFTEKIKNKGFVKPIKKDAVTTKNKEHSYQKMNTSKQTMTINGKTFTWDVPVQVTNKKRKAPKRRWTEEKNKKKMG